MLSKEQLQEMGLTDEQVTKIIEGYSDAIPRAQFNAKNDEVKALKKEVEARNLELEELKKANAGNEEIKKQLDELQATAKAREVKYEQDLHQAKLDAIINDSIYKANGKNSKAIKAMLNLDDIKLDGDTVLGLTEQLESLKKSDSYLFNDAIPTVNGLVPGQPSTDNRAGGITREQFNRMSYDEKAQLFIENQNLFKELSN